MPKTPQQIATLLSGLLPVHQECVKDSIGPDIYSELLRGLRMPTLTELMLASVCLPEDETISQILQP